MFFRRCKEVLGYNRQWDQTGSTTEVQQCHETAQVAVLWKQTPFLRRDIMHLWQLQHCVSYCLIFVFYLALFFVPSVQTLNIHTYIHNHMHACKHVFILWCVCVMVIWLFWCLLYIFIHDACDPGVYTVSHKKLVTLLWTTTPMFLGGFFCISCTNGNGNEYSIEELQNLQLYPVSPHYLIKTKVHKTAHFEVNCYSILLLNSKNESMT